MSAYILDRTEIRFLVAAAQLWELSWWDGTHHKIHRVDDAAAERAGQMLWAENVRSVSNRYPNSLDNLPGPCDRDYSYGKHSMRWSLCLATKAHNLPLQVLRMLATYEYQTCEHPEWPDSEAYQFVRMLRAEAIRRLHGYDKAEPLLSAVEDAPNTFAFVASKAVGGAS